VKDSLGDRMKQRYEDRMRFSLPRRTYAIIRADGKAFHTFTQDCERPFDAKLHGAMVAAAQALVNEAHGANFAYQQSDEISVLLTDFAKPETEAWFDGNLQKIVSVAASTVTAAFNAAYGSLNALFDARVFVIPDPVEVENYFIWRQKDAVKNSIQSVARYHYSHKQLHGKSLGEMHEMLHAKGFNWATGVAEHFKNGTIVDDDTWLAAPVFTQERHVLTQIVPRQWANA
jgi:tRNA(His) guanylyltransferase